MIKKLILSSIFCAMTSNATNLQPKLVIGLGTFTSNDKSIYDNTSSQLTSHLRDVYIGVSLFNKVAIYTNDLSINDGYKVNYSIYGQPIKIKTQTVNYGILIEPIQKIIGNHEFGIGFSVNKNRRYINDSVNSKVSYMSGCAEFLYNYVPLDAGIRTAYCPNTWTNKSKENIDLVYLTIYKRY